MRLAFPRLRQPVPRAWGWVEIAGLIGLFLVSLWVFAPRVASPASILAFWALLMATAAFIFWVSPWVLHHDPPGVRGWGFFGRPRNDLGALDTAWPAYAMFTVTGAVVIVGLAFLRDPQVVESLDVRSIVLKFAGYTVWGFVQAAAFYGFLQTRLRTVFNLPEGAPYDRRALLMTTVQATLFAATHLPNWRLASLVFICALGWSRLYFTRPNILLLALSHATLGTLVHRVLQISTRVGPFYDHPDWRLMQTLIPGLRAIFGNLF